MPLPVYLLALAVFAMGTSEFMLAGLLPDLAADLDVSVATAGLLTSAFAVGMVVGAPLIAALARLWPPRANDRALCRIETDREGESPCLHSTPKAFPAQQPRKKPI